MEKQYDDTNRGAIWKNHKQREGYRDPQFTGTLNVEGQDFYISGWKNEKQGDTQPVLSLSVRKKEQNQGNSSANSDAVDDINNDIAF